jgi:hypothetical protein
MDVPYWNRLKGDYDVVTVKLQKQESVDYVLNVEKDSLSLVGNSVTLRCLR